LPWLLNSDKNENHVHFFLCSQIVDKNKIETIL